MRVVMLSGQYMPEVFGGAQHQCDRLSRALVVRGCEVTIFTNRSRFALPFDEERDGMRIVRPFTMVPPQLMGRRLAASMLWLVRWLVWIAMRARAVDVLHAHQAKLQAYLAGLAGRIFGIPSVVKVGNAGEHDDLARMRKKFLLGGFLYRAIIRDTTAFVAISSDIEEELRGHGVPGARIFRIPNGVHQPVARDRLRAERNAARRRIASEIEPGERIFIYTGRLEAVKNLGLLIDAFARWQGSPDAPKAWLWLVGDGGERAALKRQAENTAVSERIRFHGYAEDVTPWLLAADFLVMSSIAEGMSNSLLEAMAVGTVPLSTPVSGAADLISDGENGFLAASTRIEDYIDILDRAGSVDSPMWERFSFACFDRIQGEYTMDRVAEAYLNLYRHLGACA